MDKGLTASEENILLCATYIPPLEYPFYNEESFSILEEEINHFKTHGHILICGDLNASTGQGPDTISEINTHQKTGPSPPQSVLPDITTTKLQTNMDYNYYSCAAPRDCTSSTVDPAETPMEDTPTARISALVLSIILSQTLRAFTVSPLTPLSDHSKITAYLHRPTPNQEAIKPNKLHTINQFYKWKESSVETYQNTMKQNHIQTLLDNFLDQNF